jgi:hypothetical protein
VYYAGEGQSLTVEEIKSLGEAYGGKIDYNEFLDYGHHLIFKRGNDWRGGGGTHQLTPIFYNYSLAEKQALHLLDTDEERLLGFTRFFKYTGLLFDGNGSKILVNPGQFYLTEEAFKEGGQGWEYFIWDELEPHLEEWSR